MDKSLVVISLGQYSIHMIRKKMSVRGSDEDMKMEKLNAKFRMRNVS